MIVGNHLINLQAVRYIMLQLEDIYLSASSSISFRCPSIVVFL
ncbi:hypothetical protein HMPREF0105_1884 [Bacteroides sp. 3_1_33FAA]|uniref:Uncharacterized protein n=1 Tax=Phocaeicola dorei DSM 17855 TaxID=483217 RepID=B6VXS4_9BACT|nr:hypothetical protein BACDOR_02057 [Phocaeicola dorei DSM 17855]EEZ21330.1 hypothetical protein HMPREF0105_1884 [Bacteroides sp. 3_1_33FAA]